jgi:sigma-B regulation protein RsbU (phosphoserine phosphatase)
VDDTPTNTEIVQCILDAEGFRTWTATDGLTARTMCRTEQPDLILLDVVMPGEDGFEACGRLKSDPKSADIPIIFLSSLDDVKAKVTGLKIGGVDFISTPVHAEELLARVRVHLRIRNTNLESARHYRAALEGLRNAQQAILVRPEDCPEADFAVSYQPLEETGGDFYDVVPVDSEVFGYYVADVSGPGPSAAFVTAAIKALLRQYSGPLFSPEDTMRGIGSVMRQILEEEQRMTACYARLNRRTMRLSVVSAGHPPIILVGSSGKADTVEMESDPLGIFSSLVLQHKDLQLSHGDRFFLYTDGLIEHYSDCGRPAGMGPLMDACVRYRSLPLREAVTMIVSAESGPSKDNLLLLAVDAAP